MSAANVAFADQRLAALRDHRHRVTDAGGTPVELTPDSLPDRAARHLYATLTAFSDGAAFTCTHLDPDAPQPAYAAVWTGPLVVCAGCAHRTLAVLAAGCAECGTDTDQVTVVTAGPLAVLIPLCGCHV